MIVISGFSILRKDSRDDDRLDGQRTIAVRLEQNPIRVNSGGVFIFSVWQQNILQSYQGVLTIIESKSIIVSDSK